MAGPKACKVWKEQQMIEALLNSAMAIREASGLSIRCYGAEGYTREHPFTYHAATPAQRDKAIKTLEARGFTVERVA